MTAALVLGSAPCVFEDLKCGLEKFPDAFVLAVNGACVAVEDVDAILAGHTEKAERFVTARHAAFPESKPFEVWANWAGRQRDKAYQKKYPSVTRWFGGEMSTGATSAAQAARMLLSEGYSPVVLCGCPLDDSGYFKGESTRGAGIGHDCRRVGDPAQNDHRSIIGYREKFRRLAEGEFAGKVFSFSGLTKKLLGEPA